jgi:sigma-B regulation protein RsbU (phosphoserine phosphatase)
MSASPRRRPSGASSKRRWPLGRRIQVALLPATLPEVPGWELWAGNQPSRGVSGDFYKVFAHGSEDRLGVLVADVSGKGIAASLLTGSLEALSAGPLERGEPLDDICASVSRLLHQRTPPEKYSTLFVASVDVATGDVEYVNAGHNPGLILRLSGAHEWLSATGDAGRSSARRRVHGGAGAAGSPGRRCLSTPTASPRRPTTATRNSARSG